MELLQCLKIHIDPRFQNHKEAMAAFDEFIKNIPGRILQSEIDETKTGKNGIIKDDSLYKFGVFLEENMVFLEFYQDRNQGMPTMGIYIDKQKPVITIKGSKIADIYNLSFIIDKNKIRKLSKLVK